MNLGRIALVSREYGAADFRRCFNRILDVADQLGCDQILFSLFTLHRKQQNLDLSHAFEGRRHLRQIVLETGDLWHETDLRTEIWNRNLDFPLLFKRQFAYSSEPRSAKERLISQFQQRVVGNTGTIICGEIGALRLDRKSNKVVDEYGIRSLLDRFGVRIIYGAFHDLAFRYEIARKRKFLSQDGRWHISVWNENKARGRDARQPWAVYHNGEQCTHLVHEFTNIIPNRPDIRFGLLDLTAERNITSARFLKLISEVAGGSIDRNKRQLTSQTSLD